MRVDDPNLRSTGAQGSSAAERVTTRSVGGSRGSDPVRVRDDVEISSIGEALQSLQEGSAAREARVEQLRALVQQGQYRVDAEAVARGVLDESIATPPSGADEKLGG